MKEIVSYGGGTQSTAMILMALNGEYGLIRPDFGVWADTGAEPEFINKYVDYFIEYCKTNYDFDIFKIKHKQGLMVKMTEPPTKKHNGEGFYTSSVPPFFTLAADGKIGMLMRQCTLDYKTNPISKFINSKLERKEIYRIWIGISFDERSRMKVSTKKRRLNYYPLVENFVDRQKSIQYVKDKGLRPAQRSSCVFCPFHSNRYWQWLKDFHPSELQRAAKFERDVQEIHMNNNMNNTAKIFLHKECKPLDQIQFTNPDQLDMFPELIDECGGECGI